MYCTTKGFEVQLHPCSETQGLLQSDLGEDQSEEIVKFGGIAARLKRDENHLSKGLDWIKENE